MSTELWQRQIAVTFGARGEEGKRIRGLTINFTVSKTNEPSPNTAKITIFNLSKDTRASFEDVQNVKNEATNLKTSSKIIKLDVGYGDTLEQLFIGDIIKTRSYRQGPTWVTEIEASDGDKDLRETYFQKSYKSGTNKKDVINEIISTFPNLTKGSTAGLGDETSQQGFTVSGMASDLMNKLVGNQKKEWNVQDGELQILGPKQTTGEEAILLTSDTGLINVPAKTEKGVKFDALIQTKLKPGKEVRIESELITGNYKVVTSSFKGSNRGNEFQVTCEAILL